MKREKNLAETLPIFQPSIRTILLAMILLSAAGFSQEPPAGPPPKNTKGLYGQFTVKPFKLIGNIYSIGLSNNTSWLITTPKGDFLIDPTVAEAVPDIRKNIESLGFHMKDIKYILQSHNHSDHVAGIPAMKELVPGARVPVMAQDFDVLADGGASDYRGNGKPNFTPVRADMILHDGQKLELGGVTMVAHLTPGHTKGCTTWTTVAEENGKKYNVVFNCSVRMNPGQPLIGNPRYPNLAEDFALAFKTLKSLPCDVLVASHANMFDMAEKVKRMEENPGTNPFIDPAYCKANIEMYEKVFLAQLAKEKAGGPPYAPTADDPTQKQSALPCPQDGRTCFGARPLRPAGGA